MAAKKKQGVEGLKDTAGGTKREDRYASSKYTFDPISIDAENALTVIYMLRSPEGPVVLRAIASLERFAQKAVENLELLTKLGIFDFILVLVRHDDYLVKRFAQKLIAELCEVEDFRQQVFSDDMNLGLFVGILENEDDIVMHEFASLTLSRLSSECSVIIKLLQVDGCVDILFVRIQSSDPDIQKNSLDIMKNLLNEIDGVQYFLFSPHFDLKPILDLTSSDYPVIQLTSLEVIDRFMSWYADDRIMIAFRDASGMETVIGLVENEDWTDLHSPALDTIIKAVDNPVICEYLQPSGCLHRLVKLLDESSDDAFMEKLLGAFARISQTESGRKALHANDMGRIFAECLQQQVAGIQESACLGIANMGRYLPAVDGIISANPTPTLLEILLDETKEWRLRQLATYALNVLAHEDFRTGVELLEEDRMDRLLALLSNARAVPVEIILNLLQIIIGIAMIQKTRMPLLTENVLKTLMDLIQDADDAYMKPATVQVAALECLSSLFIEEKGRDMFQQLEGTQKIIASLKSKYAAIRQWAAMLVTQMAQNLNFVKTFINHHGLQWLLSHREMRYSAPSWETAIEAIFSAYLPAKFAYTGRLDLHDLTSEGFYILRHQRKLFFVLDDLLELRASPAYPVYVANFDFNILCHSKDSVRSGGDAAAAAAPGGSPKVRGRERGDEHRVPASAAEKDVKKYMVKADRNTVDDFSWDGSLLTYDSYDASTMDGLDSIELDTFGSCPRDMYLAGYLQALKAKFANELDYGSFKDPQWLGLHPRLIRLRAHILGRFVHDEMSGPEPNPVCKDHCLQMHLNDIRYELGTNIIPVGHIKVGSYLERALLFKVLADKIGLPCALVRGSYGRAWVEIAIPVINISEPVESKETQTYFPRTPPPSVRSSMIVEEESVEDEDKTGNLCDISCYHSVVKQDKYMFPQMKISFSNAFPTRLLKPNAIVDLVQEPGRVLPINSYEADVYRGEFLHLKSSKGGAHGLLG